MNDPTVLEIEPGEPEEVITDDQAKEGIPHIVEVIGNNPVRYDHREAYADTGTTLTAGQTHTLSNFRGSGIYIAAFDGPSAVRVRPAGADLSTEPDKEVRIEGDVNAVIDEIDIEDRASREIGKARLQDSGGVLIEPATVKKQDEIISILEQIEENTSS